MNIQYKRDLEDGHSIEIGVATWDDDSGHRSVRNRYRTAAGGFSPHSSSELPIDDVRPIMEFLAEHDEISVADSVAIIRALAASIGRASR